jgi:hypothetical protein
MAARLQRIEELDSIAVAGVHWRPLRRALGVTAFGTNAYTADAGHLRVALNSGDPRIREWGATDEDLESVWNSV